MTPFILRNADSCGHLSPPPAPFLGSQQPCQRLWALHSRYSGRGWTWVSGVLSTMMGTLLISSSIVKAVLMWVQTGVVWRAGPAKTGRDCPPWGPTTNLGPSTDSGNTQVCQEQSLWLHWVKQHVLRAPRRACHTGQSEVSGTASEGKEGPASLRSTGARPPAANPLWA